MKYIVSTLILLVVSLNASEFLTTSIKEPFTWAELDMP